MHDCINPFSVVRKLFKTKANIRSVLQKSPLVPTQNQRAFWSGRGDLNTRPFGPEPNALPSCATPRLMEPMKGLEPLTCALRMRCSASWATLAYTSKDYSIVFWVCHHCRVNIFWGRDLKPKPQPLSLDFCSVKDWLNCCRQKFHGLFAFSFLIIRFRALHAQRFWK